MGSILLMIVKHCKKCKYIYGRIYMERSYELDLCPNCSTLLFFEFCEHCKDKVHREDIISGLCKTCLIVNFQKQSFDICECCDTIKPWKEISKGTDYGFRRLCDKCWSDLWDARNKVKIIKIK